MSPDKVPLSRLILFCLPNLAMGVAITAMSVVLPGFYAKHTAAGLAGVAGGMVAARLSEVITDPLIGHFSDITRGRLGSRKPWIIVGALGAPVCMIFLFAPPAAADGTYFLIWSVLTYLCWTMINIPYRGWAVELSRDYDERSKIFVAMGVAQGVGAIAFAAIPFLPFFKTSGMAPDTMRAIGLGLAASFPLTFILAAVLVPKGEPMVSEQPSLKGLWGSITGNRPLRWFLAAYMLGGVAQSAVLACFLFFADTYLHLGAHLPLALVIVYGGGFLGMPLWLASMIRLGKPHTWAIGYALIAVIGVVMAFIPPGPGALVPFLIACGVYGVANAVDAFAPYAVLGDVIDYDHWRTGTNRAGNYNALAALLQKITNAMGGGFAFLLLAFVGFDVSGKANSGRSTLGFLVVFCAVPAVFYLASTLTIWFFPIDRRRQGVIRRRLEQRAARAERAATQAAPSPAG